MKNLYPETQATAAMENAIKSGIRMALDKALEPLPAGPDPDAPAIHQAWENALDAQEAAQRLQSAMQPYAAGLVDPQDITETDRQRIALYMISVRASLTALERLIARPQRIVGMVPAIVKKEK